MCSVNCARPAKPITTTSEPTPRSFVNAFSEPTGLALRQSKAWRRSTGSDSGSTK